MIVLIDSDGLVYRVGYSTEDVDSNIAIHRLKTMINDIVDMAGGTGYRSFLSSEDKSNFRYSLDPEYKANRTLPKPRHYHVLRKHLIDKHNAEVVFDMEADDMLGIEQTDDTIIASIDKDLNQVPGKHYNYVKELIYDVSPLEGLQWFYKQILIGDTSDNVKGLHGIGPVKADKCINPLTEEYDMYQAVCDLFESKHPTDYKERVLNTGRLLKIRQSRDEGLWEPPKES